MKKLKLCRECPESQDCTCTCKEAKKFEQQDDQANYQKTPYKPVNSISHTWDRPMGNGGLSKFK